MADTCTCVLHAPLRRYQSSFSHARRLIAPNASFPTTASYLKYTSAGDCINTN